MVGDIAQMRGQERPVPPRIALGFGRVERGQNPGLSLGPVFAFAPGAGRVLQRAQAQGGEAAAHFAHGGGAQFQVGGEGLVFLAGRRSKENARPDQGAGRSGVPPEQGAQLRLFGRGEFHAGCSSGHASSPHNFEDFSK